jgi:hypothetical protein
VIKHHATHTHPFLAPTTGNDIHITGPQPEDFSATTNTYLEVILTAIDSWGLTKTATRELHPELENLAFGTDPPALAVQLNGLTAPATAVGWKGWQLNLSAPSPQTVGNRIQSFSSWSDGGTQSHVITMNGDTTYTATFVPSGYGRPKSATPVNVSLVPAFQPCAVFNRTHAAPLGFDSCAPPLQSSASATLGTPEGTGTPVLSTGRVVFTTMLGNPSTPADEADVMLSASLKDVFSLGTSTDYAGSLEAAAQLRLTDRSNSGTDTGTTSDFTLRLQMPCTPTPETTGSLCSASTSADALIPGMVVEGKRSVWELGAVNVNDGGADGDPATPGNTVLATQGVYVP